MNFDLVKKIFMGYINFLPAEAISAWVQILWINSGEIYPIKAKKKEYNKNP